MRSVEEYREAARSPNTRRTYSHLWRHWENWCADNCATPMPATTGAIAAYLVERANIGDAAATIRLRKVAIGCWHRLHGYKNPTAHNEKLNEVVAGIENTIGSQQRQVKGLSAKDLIAIRRIAKSSRDRETLALIYVMRDAMLRRSEAAAVRWEHITLEEDGTGRLFVPKSKTDQARVGTIKALSEATMEQLDEIKPLFPEGRVWKINGAGVSYRIRTICERAGLTGRYRGHSPKIGMMEDMVDAGLSVAAISQASGHKTPNMVLRYIRNKSADRSAVIRYYKSRH